MWQRAYVEIDGVRDVSARAEYVDGKAVRVEIATTPVVGTAISVGFDKERAEFVAKSVDPVGDRAQVELAPPDYFAEPDAKAAKAAKPTGAKPAPAQGDQPPQRPARTKGGEGGKSK